MLTARKPGKALQGNRAFLWGNSGVLVQKTAGYNFMISSIEKVWAKDYEIQGRKKLCKLENLWVNEAWHYKMKAKN